LVSYRGV